MSALIRFFHRGEIMSLDQSQWRQPTRSVLDWLRTSAGCTGTKEGCNEGDCGACTVAVADLAEPGDPQAVAGLRWRTVNACLQFLPTLDGRALLTVEDLRDLSADGSLHPVQQALVDEHGSQCGFCTPGFVMSLWLLYEQRLGRGADTAPERQTVADALAGNLCRCTGYRPILDAAERMFALPQRRLDAGRIVAALKAMRDERAAEPDPVAVPPPVQGDARWFAPHSLEAFAHLRKTLPQAQLLAGSTDIGLWVNKQFRELGDILYLGQVEALRRISVRKVDGMAWLEIGAAATLEEAWARVCEHWPALTELWRRFASPPVRHAGTLVGNLANGSPIGDGAPPLMALDAVLDLRLGDALRTVPLDAFYTGYMRNLLGPGEFVQALRIPLDRVPAGQRRQVRAYKISKRFDCDISAVCLGARIDTEGARVRSVRLAFGGMAATVQRAAACEAALVDRAWDEDALAAAQAAVAEDFQPLTDLRGSAGYRLQAARGLLHRLWLQTRPHDPLTDAQTRVHGALLE